MCGMALIVMFVDKTIKLWKVTDKPLYQSHAMNALSHGKITSPSQLPLPKAVRTATNDLGISNTTVAIPKKLYQYAHNYHINSLSTNSDNETFLSADDLTVNIWNLDHPSTSFSEFFDCLCCSVWITCESWQTWSTSNQIRWKSWRRSSLPPSFILSSAISWPIARR